MNRLSPLSLPILSPLFGLLGARLDAYTILVHSKDQPIGDAFLQASFFHALRCRFPQAYITFAVSLGGSPYKGSLQPVMAPFIDEVLTEQALCLHPRQISPLASRPLAGRKFDLVIDFEKKWWKCLATRRISHGVFVSAARHFLLSDRWPHNWRQPNHLSEQYLMLLDAISVPKRLDLPAPSFHDPRCEAFADYLLPDGPVYVGLVPGAGNRKKCWPLERYIALAGQLFSRGFMPVYLLGPQESDWVAPIREAVPQALMPGWTDRQMRPEFRCPLQTVALGRRLAAAVTNDCGTGHMLAAAHTPLVTLFGFTNAKKYAPLTPYLKTLTARDLGTDSVCAIPIDAVVEALMELMGTVKTRSRPAGEGAFSDQIGSRCLRREHKDSPKLVAGPRNKI